MKITEEEFHTALSKTENRMGSLGVCSGVAHHKGWSEFWYQVDTEEFEYVMKRVSDDFSEVSHTGCK
jgi:hypothetical protein